MFLANIGWVYAASLYIKKEMSVRLSDVCTILLANLWVDSSEIMHDDRF